MKKKLTGNKMKGYGVIIMYIVNYRRFDDTYDLLRYVEDHIDPEDIYQDILRDLYGDEVEICGMIYDPVIAFTRVDPTAYKCGMNDYVSSLIWDDLQPQVDGMEPGEEIDFQGLTIKMLLDDAEGYGDYDED